MSTDVRTPLSVYAGCELMHGRHRAFVPWSLIDATTNRASHDHGDEDRRESLEMYRPQIMPWTEALVYQIDHDPGDEG